MSVNSRLNAIQIIGQRKAFYRQRIPGFSCARKETVVIGILVTSRNGDRKVMQSIRITCRPPLREREWNQLASSKDIYQSNTCRKNLTWPHFDNQPRIEEREKVKDRSLAYLFLYLVQQFQVANRGTSPEMTTVFHTWAYGRSIEIQSNLRRKKFHRMN